MPEQDKLTHDERLRLESVAQAINLCGIGLPCTYVLTEAAKIEEYLRNGAPAPADELIQQ